MFSGLVVGVVLLVLILLGMGYPCINDVIIDVVVFFFFVYVVGFFDLSGVDLSYFEFFKVLVCIGYFLVF